MSADQDLLKIAEGIQGLEGRFVSAGTLGYQLRAEDQAEFKRLVLEAKSILDDQLRPLNEFSRGLFRAINSGIGTAWGPPSLAVVTEAAAVIRGGVNQIRRQPAGKGSALIAAPKSSYVALSRLAELRAARRDKFDLTRLVRLVEELNIAYNGECHMSVAMLVRAITDHIPPVLGCDNFDSVANHYAGAKSFHDSMERLNRSLRKIADAHLHVQIRRSEVLPTAPQVDFRAELDVLLGEVLRVLK